MNSTLISFVGNKDPNDAPPFDGPILSFVDFSVKRVDFSPQTSLIRRCWYEQY